MNFTDALREYADLLRRIPRDGSMEVRDEEAVEADALHARLSNSPGATLTRAERLWLTNVLSEVRKDSRNAALASAFEARLKKP